VFRFIDYLMKRERCEMIEIKIHNKRFNYKEEAELVMCDGEM